MAWTDTLKRNLGKKFQKGESIFHQGDPAECMYVIQKGQVEIVVESEYGIKELATMKTGEVFGATSLFAGKSRFSMARAVEDTWVLTLDEQSFVARLHKDPSLAFRMIRQMAHRIYDQDQALMHGFFDEKSRALEVVGLMSYIDLVAVVEKELNRAKRLWQTLAFAILDMDQFSSLKEIFERAVGEDLLQALGDTLGETLRRQDVIGRFGDNQFGVLLYEADGRAAVRVLEKVRKVLTALWLRVDNPEITTITFRCGIATYPEHETPAQLNKAAYKALATSKKTGHSIVLADPPPKKPSESPQDTGKHPKKM